MKKHFEELDEEQQKIAKNLFFNATEGDGYIYKDHTDYCKDPDGNIICRQRVLGSNREDK